MKKIRILLDICLFSITFLLMDISKIGHFPHEILGISLTFLVIFHLLLNYKWLVQTTKNFRKIKMKMKIQYVVDILTLLIYLVTIVFGILISTQIFNFSTSGSGYFILIHHIVGRLVSLMMLIHLGFHLNPMIRKVTKDETVKGVIYILYIMVSLLITIYLFYTLTTTYIWQGMV